MSQASNDSWRAIFDMYDILGHDFNKEPFYITADQIKDATRQFRETGEREPRILCKSDKREDRAQIFIDNDLFILAVKNGTYAILKGEGYIDIPTVEKDPSEYQSRLDFKLQSSEVGNSEMQHVDYAYAVSLIRTFSDDPSLVLTIRGRKYSPEFKFNFHNQELTVGGVQTEVDAGFEGSEQIVLLEAKNSSTTNTIIRQLYYPYRQWSEFTTKDVRTMFFEKRGFVYNLWEFGFEDMHRYESIKLIKTASYTIVENE